MGGRRWAAGSLSKQGEEPRNGRWLGFLCWLCFLCWSRWLLSGLVAPAAAGDNSDAAHACQQGGFLTLHRSDGGPFKNAGECVSYFAQGGTTLSGCTVTATSGCLIFDNAVVSEEDTTNFPGWTVTVNAAFSFDTSCNALTLGSTCGNPPFGEPNSYATGGGTYAIKDGTGAVVEQGTLTADDADTYEGLWFAGYSAADASTAASCAAAADRAVGVVASTSDASDTNLLLAAGTSSVDPSSNFAFMGTISGLDLEFEAIPSTGVTLTC